ncbi:MAG: hypothetical protein ACFB10_00140 [Salibacteraceae bacterium]
MALFIGLLGFSETAKGVAFLSPLPIPIQTDTSDTWEYRAPGKRKPIIINKDTLLKVQAYSGEQWEGKFVGKTGNYILLEKEGQIERIRIAELRFVKFAVPKKKKFRKVAELLQTIGGMFILTGGLFLVLAIIFRFSQILLLFFLLLGPMLAVMGALIYYTGSSILINLRK